MKKTLAILCVAGALMMTSCDNTPKFQVEGTIEGAKDSMLYFT